MIDNLYETIGGNRVIWRATEIFYRRVLEDDELKHFFDSTNMAHLQAGQSMFISMLLGGQVVYTGTAIDKAHAHARMKGLTGHHFDLFLGHFRVALAEVGVKPEKIEEIMKLLESKRRAVLNP